MEDKHHNHNGFGNGFLLGLLIGVIATLLLTTKRGREILREFTEKGLDKVSELEKKVEKKVSNVVSEAEELEEIDDEAEYIKPIKIQQTKSEAMKETALHEKGGQKFSKPRHFFRSSKN